MVARVTASANFMVFASAMTTGVWGFLIFQVIALSVSALLNSLGLILLTRLDHFTNMLNVPTEEFAIVTVVNVNASLVTKVKLAREPLALMIALVMVVACTSKTYHMLLYPKIIKRLISSNKVLRLSNTTNGTTPRLAVAIATQVMVMLIAPRDCAIKALMLWMPDLT